MTTMNKRILTLAVAALGCSQLLAGPVAETAPTTASQVAAQDDVALDRIVAVVNQDVITERELQARVHTVALNLRRQNIELPPMKVLREQVLDRLITERAIMQKARETGIRVDDQMVNASIEQIARQNKLSVEALRQRLQADGVTFNDFREEIRDEITTQRLREREVDDKITILDSEIDAYLAEQRTQANEAAAGPMHLAHILLPLSAGEDPALLDQTANDLAERARRGEDFSKLAAGFSRAPDALSGGDLGWKTTAELPAEFRDALKNAAEKGKVVVAHTRDAVHVIKVLDVKPAEKTGKTPDVFGPVTQTHARHILMFVSDITPEADVLRRLNDIKTRIEAGETDFATMARLNSVDASATRGGDLGWLQPGDTVPDFERAMDALKPGEISSPIKTQYGYHLIQVIERRTEKAGDPQRQRLLARQALREKKLNEAVYNWQRELRDQAYVEIRDRGDD